MFFKEVSARFVKNRKSREGFEGEWKYCTSREQFWRR
jgi:hypothetical protein